MVKLVKEIVLLKGMKYGDDIIIITIHNYKSMMPWQV